MARNQRKTYEPENEGDGVPRCPYCACRHHYTVRTERHGEVTLVTRVCRNCGYESVTS